LRNHGSTQPNVLPPMTRIRAKFASAVTANGRYPTIPRKMCRQTNGSKPPNAGDQHTLKHSLQPDIIT
jgi:hypothetical protein